MSSLHVSYNKPFVLISGVPFAFRHDMNCYYNERRGIYVDVEIVDGAPKSVCQQFPIYHGKNIKPLSPSQFKREMGIEMKRFL